MIFRAVILLGGNLTLVPEVQSHPLSFIDSKKLGVGYFTLQKLLFGPTEVLKMVV
jgi:hypothetical protein